MGPPEDPSVKPADGSKIGISEMAVILVPLGVATGWDMDDEEQMELQHVDRADACHGQVERGQQQELCGAMRTTPQIFDSGCTRHSGVQDG